MVVGPSRYRVNWRFDACEASSTAQNQGDKNKSSKFFGSIESIWYEFQYASCRSPAQVDCRHFRSRDVPRWHCRTTAEASRFRSFHWLMALIELHYSIHTLYKDNISCFSKRLHSLTTYIEHDLCILSIHLIRIREFAFRVILSVLKYPKTVVTSSWWLATYPKHQ